MSWNGSLTCCPSFPLSFSISSYITTITIKFKLCCHAENILLFYLFIYHRLNKECWPVPSVLSIIPFLAWQHEKSGYVDIGIVTIFRPRFLFNPLIDRDRGRMQLKSIFCSLVKRGHFSTWTTFNLYHFLFLENECKFKTMLRCQSLSLPS